MRVAVYARCSTDMQDLSISAQIREFERYCKNHDHTIVTQFIDEGESGTSDRRSSFQRMIQSATINPAPFEAVMVYDYSRFARKLRDAVHYLEQLQENGVHLISLQEQFDTSTPAGEFCANIMHAKNQYFSKQLGIDATRGMKEAMLKGFHAGGITPVGYTTKKVKDGPSERTVLQVDPYYAGIVKKIFELYCSGLGAKAISIRLNREGVVTNRGKQWNFTSIYNVLRNETYTGALVWGRYTRIRRKHQKNKTGVLFRIDSHHQAIIEPSVFLQVQQILTERGSKIIHPRSVGSPYLLGSLLWCGACGTKMTGMSTHNRWKRYLFYACGLRRRQGSSRCGAPMIPASKLEMVVVHELQTKIFTQENLNKLVDRHNRKTRTDKDGLKEKSQAIDRQIRDHEERLTRLFEVLESGRLDEEEVAPRIREHSARIATLRQEKSRLEDARRKVKPLVLNIALVTRYAKEIDQIIKKKALNEQKIFFRSFIQKIIVNWPQITISYVLPEVSISKSTRRERLPLSVDGPPSRRSNVPSGYSRRIASP